MFVAALRIGVPFFSDYSTNIWIAGPMAHMPRPSFICCCHFSLYQRAPSLGGHRRIGKIAIFKPANLYSINGAHGDFPDIVQDMPAPLLGQCRSGQKRRSVHDHIPKGGVSFDKPPAVETIRILGEVSFKESFHLLFSQPILNP
jgi:hypothetical protein